jgi:hypothetical protein
VLAGLWRIQGAACGGGVTTSVLVPLTMHTWPAPRCRARSPPSWPKAAANAARLTLVAEETVAPRRPGRPKGAVYPADLECIRRRQAQRLAAHERRLRHHLASATRRRSTTTPTKKTARSPRVRERAD